tara:strand:- start:67 stop:393 length:327 start_codon:yes stop_codon:yes gene_type:complete
MPFFKFKKEPNSELYWTVLGKFGFNKSNLFEHEVNNFDESILKNLEINNLYYKHHQILNWNRQTCIKVLRQFLKSRNLFLKSKVIRTPINTKRIYYISDNNIVRVVIH